MNKIVNDRGETVYAVGQEGSIAWCREMYPNAINLANKLYNAGNYSRMGVLTAISDCFEEFNYLNIPKEHQYIIIKISLFGINGYWQND